MVTDEDRRAAADAVMAYRDRKNGDWQARIRRGECDDGAMVQAFAAHRLASERRAYEKAAEVAAKHADQCEDTTMGRRLNSLANDIADAIRALATSPAPGSGEG